MRSDRTPTHDRPNNAGYIAAPRHVERLRDEAMNTQQERPSVKICGAVRLETRTERRSVDIILVRLCLKRENATMTPNEIETSPFTEKTRYIQRRPVDHCVRPRQGRSRCVVCATDLRRLDIQGGSNDTLQTPRVPRDPFQRASFPITHAITMNKRSEWRRVVLEQIKPRQEYERPTCLLQKRHSLGRLRKRSVQGVSVSWRRAARLLLSRCKAVWRFVKSYSMALRYNTDQSFRKQVRSLTALVFLPPEDVQTHFNRMKTLVMNDE